MQRFEITIEPSVAERALGRANIAPTQSVLTVVNGEDGSREAVLARFGLAPARAKLRRRPVADKRPRRQARELRGVEAADGIRGAPGADRRRRLLRVAEA
jgi:putative SOS response-associated peptidase YedK